jgi:uncharacterized protein (TIGR02145 family)
MKSLSILSAVLLCCVCTAGVAQTYEVPAWTPFTLKHKSSPTGVTNPSYQWYENGQVISGATATTLAMPVGKKVGVYTYTRSVMGDEGCNESNAISVRVKVNSAMTATPTHAVTPTIWIAGTQQWSDDIHYATTNCTNKSNSDGSFAGTFTTTEILTEYGVFKDANGVTRYYYSWLCASNEKTNLCDNNWHIPTKDDFTKLIAYIQANYSGDPLYVDTGGQILPKHPDFAWGYSGRIQGAAFTFPASSHYWSLEEDANPSGAHRLYYSGNILETGSYLSSKWLGQPVRCVKSN